MFTNAQRSTAVATGPPTEPRTVFADVRASKAVLDGAWWPRSWNPIEELPGLILLLDERFGQVRRLMVSSAVWDGKFRGIAVGNHVVRIGWFTSVDTGLLVASTDGGGQIDLLVVPPETAAADAATAMATAADPANELRPAAILAASRPIGVA
ncbi:hypothetical protein Dvina_20010 [Dactylosporangium vinaceum]|uniref:DUF5994 family protein n=1 Tax=Dactylosporangium vinaceum TaxID=53362 RepID=A0ABV5MSL0_9ACTN|nr:DUF5994 family protein [Dactylosporangium vinaceum]UAC00142.1 hypothetical protein Dvina_20010 [Dactylosporangium vinaceum]